MKKRKYLVIKILCLFILTIMGIGVQIHLYGDTLTGLWHNISEPDVKLMQQHVQVTYKLENDVPEYLTIERINRQQYKVFFHKKPENPMSDYIVVSNPKGEEHTNFHASYLRSEGNIVLLTLRETDPYLIDTIVSDQYCFVLQSYNYWANRLKGYDSYNIITDSKYSHLNRYTIPLYKMAVDFDNGNQVLYGDSIQWPREKAEIIRIDY